MNETDHDILACFDHLLDPGVNNPLAISVVEQLKPLHPHAAVFPPTYAGPKDKPPYAINQLTTQERNRIALDTVGSQSNRMRAIFLKQLASILPKVTIITESGEIPITAASHRLADGIVVVSTLRAEAKMAFEAYLKGDPLPIVTLDPLSLVFGVWDSRGTLARSGRIVTSTIDAWNISVLSRSAQYTPTLDYAETDLHKETKVLQVEDEKNPLAQLGFLPVPSVDKPGGVEVAGEILRLTTINLVTIQNLQVPDDTEKTLKLRRYILGLSLAAAFSQTHYFLRAGCMLTRQSRKATLESMDAKAQEFPIDWANILAFAKTAATDFITPTEAKVGRLTKGEVRRVIKEKLQTAIAKPPKKKANKRNVAAN